MSTPCGSKPGSTFISRRNLRASSPPPVATIMASANSATTSTSRTRADPPPASDPALNGDVFKSARNACAAGAIPAITPGSRRDRRRNRSTGQSGRGASKPAAPARPPTAPPPASGTAQRAARGGQQQALGHQLAAQAPGACAQRRAHRHLLAARAAARQQQVGQIDAGDQQHQADRAPQQPQRRPQPAGQIRPAGRATRMPQPVLVLGCSAASRRATV